MVVVGFAPSIIIKVQIFKLYIANITDIHIRMKFNY